LRVIISNKTHQLCNRLLVFASFVANAIENEYKVSNPGFEEYAKHFKHLEKNLFISYPPVRESSIHNGIYSFIQSKYYTLSNFIARFFFSRKIRFGGIQSINDHYFNGFGVFLDQPNFKQLIKGLKCLFVFGYGFRDWTNLIKHVDQIREYFRPNDSHQRAIDLFFSKIEQEHFDIIVGVHIRRGDYKEYKGGKFYFENSVYLDAMSQVANLFPKEKIGFLICSNEDIDLDYFKDYDVFLGLGHFIQDLYALAMCDYIMGPPSTYSFWASFFGDNRLLQISAESTIVHLEKFKRWDQIKM
jgi:hypothetical protein